VGFPVTAGMKFPANGRRRSRGRAGREDKQIYNCGKNQKFFIGLSEEKGKKIFSEYHDFIPVSSSQARNCG
jgi:hypothetical protein